MKVLALLSIIGCAVASHHHSEWQWQAGKQYSFEYSGRLLTGIPELASHYSGLGINATVVIDALSPTQLQLSVQSPRFVRVNDILEPRVNSVDGRDGANWREVILPAMSEVSSDMKIILEKPIIVDMAEGEIRMARVSRSEPEWSLNMKKALALLFQAKIDSASWLPSADNQVVTSHNDNFWKTKEQNIDGICEVTYQINELPKYMIRDRPELIPNPELCQGQKYFELIKTKNTENCVKRAAFFATRPGHYTNMALTRTSETRVVACGTRGGNLIIQTIINQGELNQDLLLLNNERIVSGNLQVLRLKEVKVATPAQAPSDMVAIMDMMYEYSYKNYQHEQQDVDVEHVSGRVPHHVLAEPEELAKVLPRSMLQGQKSPLPVTTIKQEVKTLMKSIVTEMSSPQSQNLSEKQVTMKILSVARGLGMLKKSDILSLYQLLKSEFSSSEVHKTTVRKLFYDVVLMTGTPEAVRFLKEQILKNDMSLLEMVVVLHQLPNNILIPSEQVLEELLELVQSHKFQESRVLRNIATMSFTTILEKACLAKNRETAFPSWVVGNLCTPESPILVNKWVPHLIRQLESAQTWEIKNEVIVALGMLPRQEILGKLIPFVEGHVGQQEVPVMTRLLALWSISVAGINQPQLIEPIMFALFSNPAETTEMRISAFNALIKINPSMPVFHKIAAKTWSEQDTEVLRAVNTAFITLMRTESVESMAQNIQLMTLAKKAKLTYPLIKKTLLGLAPFVSASLYTTEYLPQLESRYQLLASWIADQKSFLTKDVWIQLDYFLSQYSFNLISAGGRIEGLESIYNSLAELITPLAPGETVQAQHEVIVNKIKDNLHAEWRKIIQKLNIKTRENDKVSVAAYLRVLEATPIFGNVFEMTVSSLKEKINSIFSNPSAFIKSELNGKEHQLIAKHAMDMSPVMALIPTDMGLPLEMELHMPVVASLETKLNVLAALPKPEIRMKSRMFLTTQITGWVGTVIPFTKETAMVVIDNTVVYNLPATVKVSVDMPKQHLKLSMQLDEQMTKVTDLVHHHIHPFSVIQKIDDFTPMSLNANRKIINSVEEVKQLNKVFGDIIGLHLQAKLRTESRYIDMRSIIERLAIYNSNPVNMLLFPNTMAMNPAGTLSLRRNEFTLSIDPTQSTTKAVSFDFFFGLAYKSPSNVQSAKYHKMKILSPAEQEQRVEHEENLVMKQLKKLIPVSLVAEPVENKSLHPQRQEKIVKALSAMEQVYPSLSQTDKGVLAANVKVVATLEGGRRPLTWAYVFTTIAQHLHNEEASTFKTFWYLDTESDQAFFPRIMYRGELDGPILPNTLDIHTLRSSMIDYRLATFFTFQKGSSAWNIDSEIKAQVTHEQKEWSRKSPEALLCQKLTERKESGEIIVAKLSDPCKAMREQALTLDEIQVTLKYNNVPSWIELFEAKSVDIFKTLMWSFLRVDLDSIYQTSSTIKSINSAPTYARLQFHKDTPSFDMVIERPMEKVKFGQIRLPYPLNLVLPLKSGIVNSVKSTANLISANTILPTCVVEGKALQTFDNRSLPMITDPCAHLIAADCSIHGRFAILANDLPNGQKKVTVIIGKSKIDILAILNSHMEATTVDNLDGISLVQNEGAISISAPQFGLQELYLDVTHTMSIQLNPLVLKGHMCGLCGNFNMQYKDDLQGPKTCMYSKPEVEIAAYRIPDYPSGCDAKKPLTQNIKDLLQKESNQCLKPITIPTKLSKSMKTQTGQCTILKYAVVPRPGQICISKKAVTQCAPGCQPSQPELLEKQIPFTCLKEDRVAERYVNKAERGERLPEIEARPTAFESKVAQPRTCIPASNEL